MVLRAHLARAMSIIYLTPPSAHSSTPAASSPPKMVLRAHEPALSSASAAALPQDVRGPAVAEETTLGVGNPLHLQLTQWWQRLEMTKKLMQPTQHTIDGKLYLRMQCCNMPPYNWMEPQIQEIKNRYGGNYKECLVEASPPHRENILPFEDGTFQTFHNTARCNLEGILNDGYMRFGDWHGDGIGVYMFGYNSAGWLNPDEAMLELRAAPYLTKIGGSKSRYVLKSPLQGACSSDIGQICKAVEVVAVWFNHGFCPPLLQQCASDSSNVCGKLASFASSTPKRQDLALEQPPSPPPGRPPADRDPFPGPPPFPFPGPPPGLPPASEPSSKPTCKPTCKPMPKPTSKPTPKPTSKPIKPTSKPTSKRTANEVCSRGWRLAGHLTMDADNETVFKFTWLDEAERVVKLVPMRRGHFKVCVPSETA